LDRSKSDAEQASFQWHIYRNRLKEMWPYLRELLELRAKAGAVLGDAIAGEIEAVAKQVRMVSFYMQEHVSQLRDGAEAVAQWSDQDHVALTKRVLSTKDRTTGSASNSRRR